MSMKFTSCMNPCDVSGSPDLSEYVGSDWFLKGGQFLAEFNGAEIYVAPGNSLQVHASYLVECCVFFHENLTVNPTTGEGRLILIISTSTPLRYRKIDYEPM